jgi:hypothetical protein
LKVVAYEDELLTMNYPSVSESCGYNVLNQLTSLNSGTVTYTSGGAFFP